MHRILHSDDEVQFNHEDLLEAKEKFNLEIERVEHLDDLKKMLGTKGNDYYSAVLLDSKGKLNAGSDEDEKHLTQALKYVETWNSNQESPLPVIIYTGYTGDAAKLFEDSYPVISKSSDVSKVFEAIEKQIKNRPEDLCRKRFQDAWLAFEGGYLDEKLETNLIQLTKPLVDHKKEVSAGFQNIARQVIEGVFSSLCGFGYIPSDLIKEYKSDKSVIVTRCNHYLLGYTIQGGKGIHYVLKKEFSFLPTRIKAQLSHILKLTHPGSHYFEGVSSEKMTSAAKSIAYQVLDILEFLPQLMVKISSAPDVTFWNEYHIDDFAIGEKIQIVGELKIKEGKRIGYVNGCFVPPRLAAQYSEMNTSYLVEVLAEMTDHKGKKQWQAKEILGLHNWD